MSLLTLGKLLPRLPVLEPNDRHRRLYCQQIRRVGNVEKAKGPSTNTVVCACHPYLNTVIPFPLQIFIIFFPAKIVWKNRGGEISLPLMDKTPNLASINFRLHTRTPSPIRPHPHLSPNPPSQQASSAVSLPSPQPLNQQLLSPRPKLRTPPRQLH